MGLFKKTKTQPELIPNTSHDELESPSQDRTSRFAVDRLIRKYGYKIYQRKGGEALWVKQNVVVGQAEVLDSIDGNEVYDAEYEEAIADSIDSIFREGTG